MQTRSRSRNSIGDNPTPAKALNKQLLDVYDAANMKDDEKVDEVRKFTDAVAAKHDVVSYIAVVLTCIVITVVYVIETALYQRFSRENDYYYNEYIKDEIRRGMLVCGVMLFMLCAAINKTLT